MTQKNVAIVDGGPDHYQSVLEKIEGAGVTPRSNSVLAQEVFLSASPEFFRPKAPEKYGTFDKRQLKAWQEATTKWLQDEFGDNVIDARLHLDEATPHIHAIVVPLVKGTKKDPDKMRLSARDRFSKITLRQMQTTYAQALKPLGIERGIEGSQAKHEDVKKYYGAVNAPTPKIPQIPQPAPMFRPSVRTDYQKGINNNLKKKMKTYLCTS